MQTKEIGIGVLVNVTSPSGRVFEGMIMGESRDKTCWRIAKVGGSLNYIESYNKNRCEPLTTEQEVKS